jgi:hypothetical protein
MDLHNVVIFTTGVHNQRRFTIADLDAIEASFDALRQSGRVPLKFGHGEDDDDQPFREGLPALGWVTRVARDGDRLVADFADIPQEVAQAIKAGRYKFTSVELLSDATDAAGVTHPLVLDAVALLGADRPAVASVSDLQALTAARERPALRFARRLRFAVDDPEARLRAENARLTAEVVAAKFSEAVRDGRLLPRDREAFARRYGATATVADAEAWIAASPRPERSRGAASAPAGDTRIVGAAPDAALVEATKKYVAENEVRHFQLTGERLTFDRAAAIVAKRVAADQPELFRAYVEMMGEES